MRTALGKVCVKCGTDAWYTYRSKPRPICVECLRVYRAAKKQAPKPDTRMSDERWNRIQQQRSGAVFSCAFVNRLTGDRAVFTYKPKKRKRS